MESLFWVLLLFIFYTYLGYPLILFIKCMVRGHPRRITPMKVYPQVSVVIAARDEAENIERRIRNILVQNYPKNRLEIIIVSDGF